MIHPTQRFLQSIRIFWRCIIIYSFAYECHTCFIILGSVHTELLAIAMPTRMHSSRMRTGRSLTICLSQLRGGGGKIPKKNQKSKSKKKNQKKKLKKKIFNFFSGGVSGPRGDGSAPRGMGLLLGGVWPWGGVCSQGGWSGPGGVGVCSGGLLLGGLPQTRPPCEQNDKQV